MINIPLELGVFHRFFQSFSFELRIWVVMNKNDEIIWGKTFQKWFSYGGHFPTIYELVEQSSLRLTT